jgi:hypothetical protein
LSDDDNPVDRIVEAYRKVRFMLKTDEQLDALDDLMKGLLAMDAEERQRMCDLLIEHLKEKIENNRPVN